MRIALAAAGAVLLAACSSPPAATQASATEPTTSAPKPSSAASPTFAEPTATVLTWGGSGSSSGVFIQVDAPTASDRPVIGVDGKPDPAFRFVMLPITAGNKTAGKARLSVTGRVGQAEARVFEGDSGLGEFLPGEGGPFERRVQVPLDAEELVIEVYANVDGKRTDGRLTFKGPLP